MEGFDEVIQEFLVESYESLDQLDSDLVALEDTPEDLERLGSIFRTVHTIKGTSGFLALPTLERVAHVGENLLVPLRDGNLKLTAEIADGLLGMVDAIREILAKLESDGNEGENDFADLVMQLKSLLEGGTNKGATETDESASADTSAEAAEEKTPAAEATPPEPSAEAVEVLEKVAEETAPPAESNAVPEVQEGPTAPVAPEPKQPPPKPAKKPTGGETTERSGSVADATVRIDVRLLDKLMNLVGELVLTRNQILQFSGETEDATIIAASQRLNLITTELQEGVMKTRMQPIRNAWSKLPRVVRDLSSVCGKKVEVRMEGETTELDKTILEAIKDPLTHIVRNSVDHGIEPPEVREANGKTPEGVLLLRAFHEGGQVNIEIADDGGGINCDRVREKAIEKGLVTPDQAATMTDRELTNLILLPGFSTAPKVTNVSGRGVGMDVVKTNIERIGGTLDIQSSPGKGTTLRIKIPLTLAIVPALIVKADNDAYAIPQVSLLELVRLEGDRATSEIEFIHDTPVYRLRGNLLPIVYLDEQLGLRSHRERGCDQNNVNIVVLQAEDRQFGLVVDAVTDTQEIVVKPLSEHLKDIPAYAGATIMGDGTVALILDVIGIARRSSVLTERGAQPLGDDLNSGESFNSGTEALLLIDTDEETRAAIRLSTISRLEEFEISQIEKSGQDQVVQYRGEIMPLISLNGYGGFTPQPGTQSLNTVVYSAGEQRAGLVVGRIVDIVHEPVAALDSGQHIINERVTEILDLNQLVRQALPHANWPAA